MIASQVRRTTCSRSSAGSFRCAAVVVGAALAATALAGCGSGEEARRTAEQEAAAALDKAKEEVSGGLVHVDPLSFSPEGVRISRRGGPDALVTPDGSFKVDGKDVAITPEQRAQFVKYHESAQALRSHAIATGLAGVEVAKTALGEVFGGLMRGDTSQIEKNVEKSADGVKQAAMKVCGDLESLHAVEQSLAGLEAFAPYRFVDRAKIVDCQRETATASVAPEPDAPSAPQAPGAPPAQDPAGAARTATY